MHLGTLEFFLTGERQDLLAVPVRAALAGVVAENIGVAEIDAEASDTAAFCKRYEIGAERAANCVVIEAVRGDVRKLAACVVLATTRADINGVVRKFLDARRASFAPMDEAVLKTQMEYGAITPIGLPDDWKVLIDERVAAAEGVIVGSGVRKSKLLVPGSFLTSLPNAVVLPNLARSI